MGRFRVPVLAFCAATAGVAWLSAQASGSGSGQGNAPARIRGFSAASSVAEEAREREMKASPSAKLAEADFDVMTAEPHHTGSPYEIKLADYVADTFKSFGIDATKYEYSVLLPWPGQRRIDIVAPDQVKLQVEEEKIRGDQWADKPGILPAYNAYSPSGDVTGEIVYVNFGIPADYETLAKLGIDVKGKIVLARYGGSWRGIKPKVAAEHGAIACLIYSDPHEDGYFQGDVYPDGPFRGPGIVQRGSVMDMPRYPGDPSTPDRPSKPGVERIPMDKIETFAPIPVQPMAYRDGIELLKRLKGPVAPEAWRGALPITYRIGPGPAKVHMNLQMDYHSTYDNPTWFKKYVDPQFKYSVLAAQVTGVALLRLADAEVLPFDYESYGSQILEYLAEIEHQASQASPEGSKRVDFAGMKAAAGAFAKAGASLRSTGETLLGGRLAHSQMNTA